MPEMPEVRALAADLQTRLAGRSVGKLQVDSFAVLKTFDPPPSAVDGAPTGPVTTHGKFLDLTLGDLHLVVSLARAGWVRWHDKVPAASPRGRSAVAARLVLADGAGLTFTEAGSKKSLALWLVHDAAEVPRVATLGPDPLAPDFTEADFAPILAAAGRAQIKGVLRDQGRLAGIGNAYSDEILHAARMSPFKPASMAPDEVAGLFAAMQLVLHEAIDRSEGLAAAELKGEKKSGMRVHGRTGEACPVCGDTIRQVRFADNSLQYCPTCQTGGKPLADRALSRLGIIA